MAIHAGMLQATRTGALLTFVGKKLETFSTMFYVVRNKCLFCIAVSDRETFSKNENYQTTINSPSR